MAGKDAPPLFEFVHRSERSSKQAMLLPSWMRRGEPSTGLDAAAEPGEQAEATTHDPTPIGERAAPGAGASERRDDWRAWLRRPVGMRLPRGTWVLLGCGAMVLVMIVFFVGRKVGVTSALSHEISYDRSAADLLGYRDQPVKPDLIPPTVAGVSDRPRPRDRPTRTGPDGVTVPPPPTNAVASGSADDPREPGLNYYRLVTLPAGAEEAGRMVAFLAENGVDAVVIPEQNSGLVKIVAVKGFSKPLSDPAAGAYAERLKQLGRIWKARHRGSSDWNDLLSEKYRPGRN